MQNEKKKKEKEVQIIEEISSIESKGRNFWYFLTRSGEEVFSSNKLAKFVYLGREELYSKVLRNLSLR